MSTDLYNVLGVPRDADASAIKTAFRKLAKTHHPDRNPGDASAEARFKEVSRAFEVLSDPEKRGLYDRYGAVSLEPGFDPTAAHARSRQGPHGGFDPGMGFDVDDLLSQLFGGGRQARGPAVARAELRIDFRTAALGGERQLSFADGRTLTVRIPPGVRDGETIRLESEGLLLTLGVESHPVFRRDGEDLHVDVPLTVGEALRGAAVPVPTLQGTVKLKVPAGTQTGSTLRLRGKGVQRQGRPPGNLYAHVVVRLPEAADPAALDAALEAIEAAYTADPRAGLYSRAAA